MQLSEAQIEEFNRDGCLLFPGLFSPEEVSALRKPLPEILSRTGPEVHRESESAPPRIVFALHSFNETYRRLSLHPRILEPVETLLGSKAHIIQTRINPKSGMGSPGWTWHQDYNQWQLVDGMTEPRAILTGIFLDEITPCNAPLMIIKGSHRYGHTPIPVQAVGFEEAVVKEMADFGGGIEALMGPPGSAFLLDALTAHASTENLSPVSRYIYYMAYNSVENTPIGSGRHETRCGTDFTPMEMLEDDCLKGLN